MRAPVTLILLVAAAMSGRMNACCPVSAPGVPVVNADQTVILIWDRDRQTEHFIRQASFQSDGDSVGFLVPTPSRPQLEESGDAAFPYLAQVTAPRDSSKFVMPVGCAAAPDADFANHVRVVEEKFVAGYHVVVLAADTGNALVAWLKEHGYAYTPEAAAWAQPYLDGRWYITAMKVAKDAPVRNGTGVAASALRLSFRTDRPLFPYREPDSRKDAISLHVSDRLLRIYLVAESRYEGRFPSGQAWEAAARWSQPLKAEQRLKLLQLLRLPEETGPREFWLTQFDDHWRYGKAPGDVYFSASGDQRKLAASSPVTFDPLLIAWLGFCVCRSRLRRTRD